MATPYRQSQPQHMTRSPAKTQEERKAESERKIIRAAIELFARQGFMRTTMNEVGKEAGYTGGLVSHRFGSKEGLLAAVVDHCAHRFMDDQIQPGLETDSAEAALRNYLDIYLKELHLRESRMRALYVIMGECLGSVPEVRTSIANLNKSARSVIADIVQRGVNSGEFRQSLEPAAAAVLILGLLRGTVMQYLVDPRAFNREKILPILQTSAIAGLK